MEKLRLKEVPTAKKVLPGVSDPDMSSAMSCVFSMMQHTSTVGVSSVKAG